jgi:hypothetical protein
VGNKTAPGDGVYVRFLGTTGAYVTDTAWLQFLPREANDWRDTTLVDVPDELNHVVTTNGTQAIELQCDATNRLWRMVRPMSARANNQRMATALQQLRTAAVSKFISDDPKADLSTNGLEPAALDVWLGNDTNLLAAVHMGKDVPGRPGEVYARRDDLNSVVATAKAPLAIWQGTLNDFRDPNLLELTAPVAEIEMHGGDNFTLQLHGSNTWTEAGEKFPIESDLVHGLTQALGQLRIANFVQDFATPAGLQNYGLAPKPSREIILRAAVGDTNHEIVHLLFGAANTNGQTYVKRADEPFVYAVPSAALVWLTLQGDFYRDHHIWSFSETNVAEVTLQQNGKTRQMVRNGTNDWSLASGQGIINPPAVEETIHRLGELSAFNWYGRQSKETNEMGVTTNSLNVTIELKSGEKYSVAFGSPITLPGLNATTAMAMVTLGGEPWGFIFPPTLCPLVAENLTIP